MNRTGKSLFVLVWIMIPTSVWFGCSTRSESRQNAGTTISGFVDPDFRDAVYSRLLIRGNLFNIQSCDSLETGLAKKLSNDVTFAIQNLHVFPPTREFDGDAQLRALSDLRIDGILEFTWINSGTEKKSLNQHTFEKPYMSIDVKLIDMKTRKTAWVAKAFSSGNIHADFGQLIESFVAELPKQLRASGLVK
jgi:hypothetical protein